MIYKLVFRVCALSLVGFASVACSGVDTRRSPNIRNLPPTPVPVPAPPLRQDNYIPPAFEEYKPQSLESYVPEPDGYASYVPEKNYRDTYTTPFQEEIPVIEVLKPEPLVVKPAPIILPKPPVEPEDPRKNELDIDPFADIPERETLVQTPKNKAAAPAPVATKKSLSAAANALLLAAKAESAIGRHDAAITKVERALRIEPQSPLLWYHLANFNYNKGRYDQAISLARKSLQMATGNRELVTQNLDLMSKSATKEGNTRVFKEVMDYKKMNP